MYKKYFLWIFNCLAFQQGEEFADIITYIYDTRVDETNLHMEIISSKKHKDKA